ncbi:MAG TPA: hypothetical protein DDW79_01585, partial [Anaerolineae bacterium]|nr:hypothetical protein [Anaerolineae bacterium]
FYGFLKHPRNGLFSLRNLCAFRAFALNIILSSPQAGGGQNSSILPPTAGSYVFLGPQAPMFFGKSRDSKEPRLLEVFLG